MGAIPVGMKIAHCVHCSTQALVPMSKVNFWCEFCNRILSYKYVPKGKK